jgi:hypothetical protein
LQEIVKTTKQLQSVPGAFLDCGRSGSSLVRRLVRAKDDPAKQRIRAWLCDIDDERLRRFGLSAEHIAMLRGVSPRKPAWRLRIIQTLPRDEAVPRCGAGYRISALIVVMLVR